MPYLIHTPHHPRPYITTLAFLARDFLAWGCRVDTYPDNSAYIAEIRYREKKWSRSRGLDQKEGLVEIWAREVVVKRRQSRETTGLGGMRGDDGEGEDVLGAENERLERMTGVLREFVEGVAECGEFSQVFSTSG